MRRSGSHWDEGAGWVFGSALLMARLRTVVASVLLLRAEAGVCARRRSNFLLAAKRKSPKRRRPPVCVPRSPCRANGGSLRCSVLGWCRRTHCVLPSGELRSNSCGKPDHEVRVSCGTRTHPRPCASRRSQQGWGAGTTRLLLRSCAWGRLRAARCRRAAQPPWRAERSEGPRGRAKQWPVWSPLPPPSDRAEKRRAWGERVPKDTRLVIWLAEAV